MCSTDRVRAVLFRRDMYGGSTAVPVRDVTHTNRLSMTVETRLSKSKKRWLVLVTSRTPADDYSRGAVSSFVHTCSCAGRKCATARRHIALICSCHPGLLCILLYVDCSFGCCYGLLVGPSDVGNVLCWSGTKISARARRNNLLMVDINTRV